MELNKNQTLDNFIVGKSNKLAYSYSKNCQILKNPVLFTGNQGLGKTHLLNGIGNDFIQKGFKVIYLWGEEFIDCLINAIYHHRLNQFKKAFLTYDVILIDHLEVCIGKESSTKMLNSLLKQWIQSNKIVAFASNNEGAQWIQMHFKDIDVVTIEDFDDDLSEKVIKKAMEGHDKEVIDQYENHVSRIKYKNMYQVYNAMQEVIVEEFMREVEI